MSWTTGPLAGAVVGALLMLAGLYLVSDGTGSIAYLGWVFLAVGALGVIVNLVLSRRTDRG